MLSLLVTESGFKNAVTKSFCSKCLILQFVFTTSAMTVRVTSLLPDYAVEESRSLEDTADVCVSPADVSSVAAIDSVAVDSSRSAT